MASRDERLQQRLRGAQTRQVGEVDFGLVFAPIGPPPPSLRPESESQSIQPSLPTQLSQQTPARPTEVADTSSIQANSQKILIHNANTSAKLRKLETDPLLSSRSTRSSRRTPHTDLYTLVDESHAKSIDTAKISSNAQISQSIVEQEITSVDIVSRQATPVRTVEQVTESPANAPGSGRRLRIIEKVTSTGSQLQLVQAENLADSAATPITSRKRKRNELLPRDISPDLSQDALVPRPTNSDDVDELSPEQPTLKSRRTRLTALEPVLELAVEDGVEATAIDNAEAAILWKKNRRRSPRNLPAASPELDDSVSSIARKLKGKHRAESSPAQQRQRKAKPNTKNGKSKDSRKRYGSPIPVTVHRMTKPMVYEAEEAGIDVLDSEIPRPKRGDPNIIDVLSQVCQEIVTSTLESLEEVGNKSDDMTIRREYRTKWAGVKAFGRELQTRLLEHTINLDNSDSLQKRLRDEQKRKIDLRKQICHVRAEREKVALCIDKVRIQHESETRRALSREDLNNSVHDIELVVELGKSSHITGGGEMDGIELLLKRTADQVSNKSTSGGLLRQLKESNAFLERAALALEGRRI